MANPLPSAELMQQAGLRLRAVRLALDLGQDAFANAIGVERPALSNWENGIRLVSVIAMVRLAQRFGIPLDFIYVGSLRQVPYELAAKLEHHAAELGAVLGGPVAEWPMQVQEPRPPAARPPRRPRPSGTLHESPPDKPG